MNFGSLLSWLFFFNRIRADVKAVQKGRIGERIFNRGIGRLNAKIMRRLWK